MYSDTTMLELIESSFNVAFNPYLSSNIICLTKIVSNGYYLNDGFIIINKLEIK